MSKYIQRISPLPPLGDDHYPCPQCSKLLTAEEFNHHLKICDFLTENDEITDRNPSYTVMSCHEEIRVLCRYCGRKFMPERISKHELVCENLLKKRPTFDITKKIFPSLDQDHSTTVKSKKKIKFSKEFEDRLWHKQHQDFINKMRFARHVVEAEEKGFSPIKLKPPSSLVDDLIECPICHRRFAPIPAERHIPKCKDIIHRPKPPPLYREPSTKLPKLKKELREGNEAHSMSPSHSRPVLDKSPNTTLNSIPMERYSEGRRSFKDNKISTKCPHCRKSVLLSKFKLHLSTCRYVSHQGHFPINGKCPNCEYSLLPTAKFCMMCGTKID